jgi:AraC family transcriptional regulator of adaptative response / DNA-3-methyladenine glycosylase II
MADIAYSSGFRSVRSFNDLIQKSFRSTPTELRRKPRTQDRPLQGADIVLQLPYRPPYDWASIIEFLAARAIPGVESVTRDSYRRTIVNGSSQGIAEVGPGNGGPFLVLRLQLCRPRQLLHIVERFRRVFDTGADPAEIANHLSSDPRLSPIVDRHPGLRVPGAWDGFELAVRVILGQQVSVKAASSLAGNLVRRFGERLSCESSDELTHLFPPPETLARYDLTQLGIPRFRAQAIRELASRVSAGELVLDASLGVDDVVKRLSTVPGVGAWTAQYIAMRALREPDAFPEGDLGLRRAVMIEDKFTTPSQLACVAEEWRPWRAYAAMYLWKTAGSKGEK